jgi:shikimate dehydrogenase
LKRSGLQVSGRRILQAGAGGAGRATAFALAEAGAAELVIADRTTARAEALAAAVSVAHPQCFSRAGLADPHGFDILVNTTSVGMKPGDPPPVDNSRLSANTAVAEIIMAPEETPLLRAARGAVCRKVAGRMMIEGQLSLLTEFLGLQGRRESRG